VVREAHGFIDYNATVDSSAMDGIDEVLPERNCSPIAANRPFSSPQSHAPKQLCLDRVVPTLLNYARKAR
jgi:hypothetical protein